MITDIGSVRINRPSMVLAPREHAAYLAGYCRANRDECLRRARDAEPDTKNFWVVSARNWHHDYMRHMRRRVRR